MTLGKLLFSFTGRIGRAPYWIANIALTIAAVVLSFVVGVAAAFVTERSQLTEQQFMIALFPWAMLLWAMICYPAAAIIAKRLQDRDKPGWLAALLFVPMLVSVGSEPTYWGGGNSAVARPVSSPAAPGVR